MTLPARGHEFLRAVQQASQGTPYQVTETEHGFDVALDIVDAEWFGVFNKAGLEKTYVHHVTVHPDGESYSVTDDSRSVEWVAGTPQISGQAERVHGRVKEFGTRKVWAFDQHGRFGVQADYRFDSEEGRDLISGVARQVGMSERRGAAERTGLVVGVVGAVGAAITIVVVVVLALTGYFS